MASKLFKIFKNLMPLVLGAGVIVSGAAQAADIASIRFGVASPAQTRIVVDMNAEAAFAIANSAGSSNAATLEIKASALRPGAPARGKGMGLIADYAVTAAGGDLRIELKSNSTFKIKDIFLLMPSRDSRRHRLVLDIVRAEGGAQAIASAAPKPATPTPRYETLADVIAANTAPVNPTATPAPALPPAPVIKAPVAEAPAGKPVIVIDAGHGGSDPGAEGQGGLIESKATLAAALALQEALVATGRYDVVLTRSKDSRLAHEQRSKIARAAIGRSAKAGLFISLHADAHSDKDVRGGSVYTLSEEGTERSAREALAAGNYNVFDLDIGAEKPEVGGILYDLAQRRTENESDRFAELLIAKLSGSTRLLNNTHRKGNFKVLLSPDVPAVLLELAFISNAKDEANLKSPAWRKRAMSAVAVAIDAYFAERQESLHASNTPAGASR